MDSKRPARRDFLKSGAALAGGLTLGTAAPAIGQTPDHPDHPTLIKGDKDQIAYGDRSRFVTSARIAHGRLDGRTPLGAAQGVRTESRGHLVRRGGVGGSEGRVEHADRESDG